MFSMRVESDESSRDEESREGFRQVHGEVEDELVSADVSTT